jgi:hypothetical protein
MTMASEQSELDRASSIIAKYLLAGWVTNKSLIIRSQKYIWFGDIPGH